MSAADIFRITDEDGDILEVRDDHTEERIRVSMNDSSAVYLTLDDLDKLGDAVSAMYRRRDSLLPKPVAENPRPRLGQLAV